MMNDEEQIQELYRLYWKYIIEVVQDHSTKDGPFLMEKPAALSFRFMLFFHFIHSFIGKLYQRR